jgi:mRNA interferase MazF
MRAGSIVIAPLPQSDGALKRRPVVVLCELPRFRDLLVCGVSSQLEQQAPEFDEILETTDADFANSGLRQASLIRLGFLAVLPIGEVHGRIGSIARERHNRLLTRLASYLTDYVSS